MKGGLEVKCYVTAWTNETKSVLEFLKNSDEKRYGILNSWQREDSSDIDIPEQDSDEAVDDPHMVDFMDSSNFFFENRKFLQHIIYNS